MRLWIALLLSGGLAAGEGEPPVQAPLPALSFAATSMSLSMSPGRPSEMVDARIGYEAVRLACQRLTYHLAALAGAPRPVLASADLTGGPDGRVLFDTAASQLPQVAFRGVMRPGALTVRRLDPDPARPNEVRFHAEATDLGDVDGIIATPAGPRRHVIWAERAALDFVGTVAVGAAVGIGIATPRLVALHFYGRSEPVRPASVLRLPPGAPPEPHQAEALLAAHGYDMRASGSVISLYFDDLGALERIDGVEEFEGDGLVPMRGPNRPVLKK